MRSIRSHVATTARWSLNRPASDLFACVMGITLTGYSSAKQQTKRPETGPRLRQD